MAAWKAAATLNPAGLSRENRLSLFAFPVLSVVAAWKAAATVGGNRDAIASPAEFLSFRIVPGRQRNVAPAMLAATPSLHS